MSLPRPVIVVPGITEAELRSHDQRAPTWRFAWLFVGVLALGACRTTHFPVLSESAQEIRQVPVTTLEEPLASVCRLQVTRVRFGISTRQAFSSGALLGDGLLLTAAHNVYSPWYNVAAGDIECDLSVRGTGAGLQASFPRANIGLLSEYDWGVFDRDVALVRIDVVVQSAFEVASDDLMIGADEHVHIGGFPGDGYTEAGESLHRGAGRILGATDHFLTYEITTATGNSGGPVWIERDGRFIIVGVHVAGEGFTGTARRVSASLVAELKRTLPAGPAPQ